MNNPVQEIYYLSVLPGSGKTFGSISNIIKDREHIHFYISPTIKLCAQFAEDLDSRSAKEELYIEYFHISSKSEMRDIHADRQDETNYLSTTEHVKILLEGGILSGSPVDPIPDGSVIIMTHETFFRLGDAIDHHRSRIKVFFDEARKCHLTVPIKGFSRRRDAHALLDAFNRHITPVVVPNKDASDEDSPEVVSSGIVQLSIPEENKAEVLKKAAEHTRAPSSRQNYTTLCDVVNYASSGKFGVFLTEEQLDPEEFLNGTSSIHVITFPKKVFEGYSKVMLLGAYMEDSQMFHFLKREESVSLLDFRQYYRDNHPELFPLRNLVPKHSLSREDTAAAYYRLSEIDTNSFLTTFVRHEAIKRNLKKATIYPLTLREKKLSRYHLDTDILCKAKNLKKIEDFLYSKNCRVSRLRSILPPTNRHKIHEYRRKKFSDQDLEVINFIGENDFKVFVSPIEYYVKSSLNLINRLKEREVEIVGTPICVINNRYRENPIFESLEDRNEIDFIPTMSHGINKYKDRNCAIYLAAINPSPAMYRLFSALIPEYDPDKDYTADYAVQVVTRMSVRDALSKKNHHIIVSDLEVAGLLMEKFRNLPILDESNAKKFQFLPLECKIRKENGIKLMGEGRKKGNEEVKRKYTKVRDEERDLLYSKIRAYKLRLRRLKFSNLPRSETERDIVILENHIEDLKIKLKNKDIELGNLPYNG